MFTVGLERSARPQPALDNQVLVPTGHGDRVMKITGNIIHMVALLAAIGLLGAVKPAVANVEADCRQEAEDYGVAPEQMEEYVYACISSRGGDQPVDADQGRDSEDDAAEAGEDESPS
jgi:hypothetical protein